MEEKQYANRLPVLTKSVEFLAARPEVSMPALQTLRDGNLDEAFRELQQEVRRSPADAKLRVFLFQLLSVQGQWDRALVQLNTAAELDHSTLIMAQMYREALQCEVLRAEVFAGKRSPLIFGDPPQWMGWLVEALRLTADGQHEAAQELRAKAFEEAPATSGSLDGAPFEWIADADTRLGPVVEAMISGRYFWVPMENIRQIKVEPPTDLRDLVWLPVHFVWSNEGDAVGLIPTRYPGSEESHDNLIRMARKTEWAAPAEGASHGLGQRMFSTEETDYPLLDIRQIDLGPTAETATPQE
jgi:type VI secretion system protein ImpE